MVSDLSKWKIVNGCVDTSDGDKIIEKILLEDKQWRKEHKHIPKPRVKLTDEQRKQKIKEYQHNYYLKVLKLKRKARRRLKQDLLKGE